MRSVKSTDLTTRARLRDAALKLFAERGYEATSTRAIAAEAGVSAGLVIHHFGSKERLRGEVDDEVLRIFDDAVENLSADTGAVDLLAALGALSARIFGADPILRAYLRRALLTDSEANRTLFGRLLKGAQRELDRLGSVSGLRPDADPLWAPYQVLFLILGPMLLESVLQPTLDVPAFAEDVIARRSEANQRLLLHGILAAE